MTEFDEMAIATYCYDWWPWCRECGGFGFTVRSTGFARCARATEAGHGRHWLQMWREEARNAGNR